MRIIRAFAVFLASFAASETCVLAYSFGSIPLADVQLAAQNHNTCASLPTEKLVAYMLSPTWWEVTGADGNRTPSPMTLSRGDNSIGLYPDGQAGATSTDRRAFWHPGIGVWQLDDQGIGSSLSVGRFNTQEAAIHIAKTMSERYCKAPTALSVFGPWCACAANNICNPDERSDCETTFNKLYNPNGPPEHTVQSDGSTGRWGGAEVRTCRLVGASATFTCVYVDPARAEGWTSSWFGSSQGVAPPDTPSPLAKSFYVYKEVDEGTAYEWRHWMAADTGFGIDYAAKRAYLANSRTSLDWTPNADETPPALCDVTMSRGNCSQSGTGTIRVEATLDGAPWSGPVSYSVSGATSFTGTTTGPHPNLSPGGYTVQYLSGGPGRFVEIVPAASQSLVAGATISWTLKFSAVCTAVSGTSLAADSAAASSCPPLVVALSANPASGIAPLNDIGLTASVSGTATGTINYTFYCRRADDGLDIRSPSSAKFDGITANTKTVAGLCDYTLPGTYTAKVIAERGSSAAEARVNITVGQQSSGGVPPVVTTIGATGVTQNSASLGLTVNPNGSATNVWFEWGTNTNMTQTTAIQGVGSGTTGIPASFTLANLSCGTTYFFRSRAQNTQGPAALGAFLPFSTAACGCGGGGSQTEDLIDNGTFGADSAFWTRSGNFNADRQFTDFHDGPGYAYLSQSNGSPGNGLNGELYQQVSIPSDATSATLRFWTKITTSEPTGGPAEDFLNATLQTSSGAFLASLQIYSNQNASSSYVQRSFNLVNFIGQTFRLHFLGSTNTDSQPTVFRIDDVSLDIARPVGAAPVVTTQSADQVTATSARLNLTVDQNDLATTVWFDLDPNDTTPSSDTPHVAVGCGSQAVPASIGVFGLQCNTRYHFRANAENSRGDDDGSTLSFTTSACNAGEGSPTADTDPATDIGQSSAMLTADVNANGLPTQAWFAWGTSTALGQETPHVSVGAGMGPVNFSQGLAGLACGSTYYFRNHVSNSAGQDSGATLSFDTTPCTSNSGALLFSSRQACSGSEPAVLLGWTMPQGADPFVTIRRSDGQYVATVNTANGGPVLDVDSGLIFGNVYRFTAEVQVNGLTLTSNELVVPITSDECKPSVNPGDLPHRPLLRAKPAICENGVAKVELFWTEAAGAESYSLQRISAVTPSVTHDGIVGRSFKDTVTPGDGLLYQLRAHNSTGLVSSWNVGLIVPGTVCTTAGAPGTFSASIENPTCRDSKGAVTVRWSQSAGAASDYRVFDFRDHELAGFNPEDDDFFASLEQLDPGTVIRAVVQAQSAAAPGKFREASPVARLIPMNVCGAGTAIPSVGGEAALYIRADQALLRASITAHRSETSAYFEWGTSPAYGFRTPTRPVGNKHSFLTFAEVLTGLSCGTTYHFRTVASSVQGTAQGVGSTFTTSPCPPTPPILTVTATDPTSTEQPTAAGEFLIQRTGSTALDLSVSYTVGGTATAGVDHTLGSGSVTIPAGSASRALTLTPIDDSSVEPDETVIVTLEPQGNYIVGSPSNASVTISSDDVSPGPSIFSDGFESGNLSNWSPSPPL